MLSATAPSSRSSGLYLLFLEDKLFRLFVALELERRLVASAYAVRLDFVYRTSEGQNKPLRWKGVPRKDG